jgi:transposase-like protein
VAANKIGSAMRDGSTEGLALYVDEDRQQRAATLLKNVAYIIEARVELTAKGRADPSESVLKHMEMARRRATKGQFYHHPYLGTREGSVAIFRGSPGRGIIGGRLILCGAAVVQGVAFKGRQFTAEVILWAVRWYLMFPISYRDLELMLLDRGVAVDHTTIFRWIQAYSVELEKRIRSHLKMSNGSWRVDETYIKVKGRWTYLYRAVDKCGQTIDFLLSAKRDAAAAKRFFRKALAQPHTVNPRTITVDKNPSYPKAVAEMKNDAELWRRSRLRQVKYLNNILEQDHRRIKRLTGPGLGFGGFRTARRTLAGFEAMAMIRKGQVRYIAGNDIRAQSSFIAGLFQIAA